MRRARTGAVRQPAITAPVFALTVCNHNRQTRNRIEVSRTPVWRILLGRVHLLPRHTFQAASTCCIMPRSCTIHCFGSQGKALEPNRWMGAPRSSSAAFPRFGIFRKSTECEHLFVSRLFLRNLRVSLHRFVKLHGFGLRNVQNSGLKAFPQMVHHAGNF